MHPQIQSQGGRSSQDDGTWQGGCICGSRENSRQWPPPISGYHPEKSLRLSGCRQSYGKYNYRAVLAIFNRYLGRLYKFEWPSECSAHPQRGSRSQGNHLGRRGTLSIPAHDTGAAFGSPSGVPLSIDFKTGASLAPPVIIYRRKRLSPTRLL